MTPGYGSRQDPHAQARQAREAPLLLDSLSAFQEIFEILFAHRRIADVVEVGVESAASSSRYTDLGALLVHCVEPHPSAELRRAVDENPRLRLVETPSPAALATLPAADLYVLDGDHNHATVRGELGWITATAPDSLVVVHHVLWPCARRDLYYQPSPLRPDERQPDSTDGPTVWHDELTPTGFTGLGVFTSAERAGGEHNGVLTAVEDTLRTLTDSSWRFVVVPAVFGLGVLYRHRSAADDRLARALAPYQNSRLLYAMENNRIALYTRLLRLQSEVDSFEAG
ncbi:hypothetical protein HUW46_06928 [Amycolatopsis sp. CA-230715]|nr:hypothetical protein HUW46_06928 [Amycolatopsis sp. CA-230715]